MALRAFQNNPSIGGFGNESGFIIGQQLQLSLRQQQKEDDDEENEEESKRQHRQQVKSKDGFRSNPNPRSTNDDKVDNDRKSSFARNKICKNSRSKSKSSRSQISNGCDAFAQILKELVDNAVDACSSCVDTDTIDIDNDNNKGSVGQKKGGKVQKKKTRHNSTNNGSRSASTCTSSRLKRVRVSIEKVSSRASFCSSSSSSSTSLPTNSKDVRQPTDVSSPSSLGHSNTKHDDDDDEDVDDLLRVTVSDNGCGMDDIEKCVSVFSTSKSGAGSTAGVGVGVGVGTGSVDNDKKGQNSIPSTQTQTAGRYGVGLTLCLLHAQRLVPDSCASITSSTSSQRCWTVAKFVVDTDRDVVVCVEKKTIEKRGRGSSTSGGCGSNGSSGGNGGSSNGSSNESGTAVSLLVPGGVNAQRAWPRLAEYFARFQLSLELKCSLQVMAPSLSPRPLFIRPVCEKKEIQRRKEQLQLLEQQQQQVEPSFESNSNTVGSLVMENDGNNNGKNKSDEELSRGLQSNNGEDGGDEDKIDWIDSVDNHGVEMIASLDNSQTMQQINELEGSVEGEEGEEEENREDEVWFDSLDDDLNAVDMEVKKLSDSQEDNEEKGALTSKMKAKQSFGGNNGDGDDDDDEGCQKKLIQTAVSSYLQKPVSVENIAHSNQKIRFENRSFEGLREKSNGPSLEVTMIVCEGGEEEEESYDEQELSDDEDSINSNTVTDPKTAKIFLVRMVNEIPLLDGAEASACGIVQGIATKRSMWNSFGLDVAPLARSVIPNSNGRNSRNSHMKTSETSHREYSSSFLQIPTFSLRDSAQVAPYFSSQTHTHSLFNGDIEEDESSCSSIDDMCMDDRKKRKKKHKILLLPAGLRLGKILIIVQLRANPSELPLPTLSKGRLPMNDKGIDDALELGITSCLHSLQKSTPSLLLNASQLKRTERDVKFIPSIASALSSIVLNCHDSEQQRDMMNIINSWTMPSVEDNDKLSVVTPDDKRLNNTVYEMELEMNDSINEGVEINNGSRKIVGYHYGPNTNSARYMAQETTTLITSRFREVISIIGERKAEQSKKAKAEYFQKKKKKHARCSDDDDEGNGNDEKSDTSSDSDADLDDFLTQKSTRSIDSCDKSEPDSNSENPEHNNEESYSNSNGAEGRVLNSDEDDFDDDEWW